MAHVSRRGFLAGTTASAAALGAAVAIPGAIEGVEAASIPRLDLKRSELQGDVVLHVRDLQTGEVALTVGTRQIVYRDPALVKRLLRAAR